MLPFLKPKKSVSVIIAKRKPSGEVEAQHEEGEHGDGLMAAAEDLIRAVHSKDAKAVASALMAAMDCMDAELPEPEAVE